MIPKIAKGMISSEKCNVRTQITPCVVYRKLFFKKWKCLSVELGEKESR